MMSYFRVIFPVFVLALIMPGQALAVDMSVEQSHVMPNTGSSSALVSATHSQNDLLNLVQANGGARSSHGSITIDEGPRNSKGEGQTIISFDDHDLLVDYFFWKPTGYIFTEVFILEDKDLLTKGRKLYRWTYADVDPQEIADFHLSAIAAVPASMDPSSFTNSNLGNVNFGEGALYDGVMDGIDAYNADPIDDSASFVFKFNKDSLMSFVTWIANATGTHPIYLNQPGGNMSLQFKYNHDVDERSIWLSLIPKRDDDRNVIGYYVGRFYHYNDQGQLKHLLTYFPSGNRKRYTNIEIDDTTGNMILKVDRYNEYDGSPVTFQYTREYDKDTGEEENDFTNTYVYSGNTLINQIDKYYDRMEDGFYTESIYDHSKNVNIVHEWERHYILHVPHVRIIKTHVYLREPNSLENLPENLIVSLSPGVTEAKASSVSRRVILEDTSPPSVPIVEDPEVPAIYDGEHFITLESGFQVTFSSTDAETTVNSFRYRLKRPSDVSIESLPWIELGTGDTDVSLESEIVENGDYVFEVQAKDVAQNWSNSSFRTFTIDRGAPVISGVNGPDLTNESEVVIVLSASDNEGDLGYFGYRLTSPDGNTSDWIQQAEDEIILNTQIQLEGEYTVEVQAFDVIGNSSNIASHSFTIDRTAPDVFLSSEFVVGEGLYQAVYQVVDVVDGESFAQGIPILLFHGPNDIQLNLRDNAGNQVILSYQVIYDEVTGNIDSFFPGGARSASQIAFDGIIRRITSEDQEE